MGVPVVSLANGPEPLLTSRVPNLHLNDLVISLHCLDFKVHTDRAQVAVVEGPVGKSQQHGGLSCATLANQHNLEEAIEFVGREVLGVLFDPTPYMLPVCFC